MINNMASLGLREKLYLPQMGPVDVLRVTHGAKGEFGTPSGEGQYYQCYICGNVEVQVHFKGGSTIKNLLMTPSVRDNIT